MIMLAVSGTISDNQANDHIMIPAHSAAQGYRTRYTVATLTSLMVVPGSYV